MSSWIEFWNRDPSIYANERHKLLHYRGVASDIVRLIDRDGVRVLDHGSGEASSAGLVAARAGELVLCDAAPNTREKISQKFADHANIRVIGPERLGDHPDGYFDLIIANSVLQYLDEPTLEASLVEWRRLLKPDGRLILADVIPPDVSPVTDALALLRFAFQGGFLGAALLGLVRTTLSDYRTLRGELGFSTHSADELISRLDRHGFDARRLAHNIGHNSARMTFEARHKADRVV